MTVIKYLTTYSINQIIKHMDMITLGKMEQVKDLRAVWPHEALSFTPWLKDNLDLLSKAVGIEFDYEHVERESDVGDFSVDLYTQEAYEGGRRIIIENQLEKSNHDHLGKIITYASGKDAGIVIWIVSEARAEHRQAVEWLNQHTDDGCAFFLLEIELWKVDGSNPAPKFNVVERPNDWARQMRKASLSEAEKNRLEFWEAFKERAEKNKTFTSVISSLQKPQPQNWYNISIGSSTYYICLVASTELVQHKHRQLHLLHLPCRIHSEENCKCWHLHQQRQGGLREVSGERAGAGRHTGNK